MAIDRQRKQSKNNALIWNYAAKKIQKIVPDPVNIHREAHKSAWIQRIAAQEQAQQ